MLKICKSARALFTHSNSFQFETSMIKTVALSETQTVTLHISETECKNHPSARVNCVQCTHCRTSKVILRMIRRSYFHNTCLPMSLKTKEEPERESSRKSGAVLVILYGSHCCCVLVHRWRHGQGQSPEWLFRFRTRNGGIYEWNFSLQIRKSAKKNYPEWYQPQNYNEIIQNSNFNWC